jgi:hypothetical protein
MASSGINRRDEDLSTAGRHQRGGKRLQAGAVLQVVYGGAAGRYCVFTQKGKGAGPKIVSMESQVFSSLAAIEAGSSLSNSSNAHRDGVGDPWLR